MPEGPEVKSMVIQLNKYLSGKTLQQVVLHQEDIARNLQIILMILYKLFHLKL